MTIVVETGAGLTNSNSYVSTAELIAFAAARGITLVADEEQLLIKAMDYIESLEYQGLKSGQDQALQWPRVSVVVDGYAVESDTIPQLLKNGQMQTALAIDAGTDPQQTAPRAVKSQTVGDLSVVYMDGAGALTIDKKINAFLYKLLASGGTGANSVRMVKA